MIAKIILSLLQETAPDGYASGRQAMDAWGANAFTNGDVADVHGIGWLRFKVNGSNFKGWVRISMQNDSRFDVGFEDLNHKAGNYGIVRKLPSVEGNMLSTVIDNVVEGERP